MREAATPENEAQRLQALFDYHVLDTDPEQAFDQLTALASQICETPIALVSLIDETRQWFKSHHGLDATETPRRVAFCSHAILQDQIFEIPDSTQDERFSDNPLVISEPKVIFYAGAPLQTPDGHNLGTLCVIDHHPNHLSEKQKNALRIIANQVVTQLELRKNIRVKDQIHTELMDLLNLVGKKNAELNQFSSRAAHDLKAPLARIKSMVEFCLEDLNHGKTEQVIENCHFIKQSCTDLDSLIQDIVDLTRAELTSKGSEKINFRKIIAQSLGEVEKLAEDLNVHINYKIDVNKDFFSQAIRIQQIIYNLASNGVKYSNPEQASKYVKILIEDTESGVIIKIKDNGLGIPEKYQEKIYDAFERFHPRVASGNGLGTLIVKKHVQALQGHINFISSDSGTEFKIELPTYDAAS